MPAHPRARSLCAMLFVAMLAPLSAGDAQGARPDSARDSTAVKLRAVSVTGARATGVTGGASALLLNTEALRASPAPLLEQALRESPFVHVRQNSRGETELSVRGSDSRQASVIVDGVPLTLGWDHRADPSLVPVTGAQDIVIVRGLGSLLNGPNTLGGSIEVNHRAPTSNSMWLNGGMDENSAMVTSLGGERLLGSMMGGSLSMRGGFAYRKRDGFALPEGATDPTASDGLRTNSDLRHTDGFASLNWNASEGRALSLTVTGFDAERGVPPEEHITAPRLWRYPYHTRAVASLSGNTGTFSTPFGTGSIDAGLGYNSGRMKISSYTDRTYATTNGEELGDERTTVGRMRLTHSLKSATLRAAATLSNITYHETLSGTAADYRQTLNSYGAEVEAPVGGRTTVAGGVVLDQSSTPETGGRTPGQPDINNVGWRAGLAYETNSAWRLHASASQRSRFPALRELYSGALNRFQPNPGLKPETLLGIEGGVTVNRLMGANASLVAEATVFSHNLDDAVVRITVPNPTPPPATLFRRVNRDNIISSGLELMAGVSLGANRDRAVTIAGDATVQRITIKDVTLAGQPERHSENNPENRGSLELGVPLPMRLRGTANARYTGTQYCINADSGAEMTLDRQAETDLAVERGFTLKRGGFRSLRLVLAVDNAANATVYDQCGLPQPGRTLRVMFGVR
jgi:iron complex outermembrane receptor protein